MNRLYNELLAIDPELAAELRRKSGHCFGGNPEEVPEEVPVEVFGSKAYLKRVLSTAF